jgi:hypothetical protein
MTTIRTEAENAALMEEAERRVRAGESHADVADALGVPPSTFSLWARKGRWRRKDIACEINEERGRAMLAQIAERAAAEQAAMLERTARAKELAEAAEAAMRAADPGRSGKPEGLMSPSTPSLSLAMAHHLVQQGMLDEAERATRIAQRFAQAEQTMNARLAEEWKTDRAKIMSWWEKNRDTVSRLREYALEMTEELEGAKKYEMDLLDFECCPACHRSLKFWPAGQDAEDEKILDGFIRENR